jgi:hypothetical protein
VPFHLTKIAMNQDFRAKVAAAKAHIEKIRHGYGIQTAELEPQQSLCTQALEKSLTMYVLTA